MRSVETEVWLQGEPVYSLSYFEGKKIRLSDISSYRPDPREILRKRTVYPATIWWQKTDVGGVKIETIQKIRVGESYFVRIR